MKKASKEEKKVFFVSIITLVFSEFFGWLDRRLGDLYDLGTAF